MAQKTLITAFAIMVVLSCAQLRLRAECLPKTNPKRESAYAYIETVIDTLEWVKSAQARVSKDAKAGDFFALVRDLRTAQRDLKCGVEGLQPYRNSENDFIKMTADVLALILTKMSLNDDDAIKLLADCLDDPRSCSPGTLTEKGGSMMAESDETMRQLLEAAALSTNALVRYENDRAIGFEITSQQRLQLLKKLERGFGPAVKAGAKADQLPPQAAAGLLYGFISDRKWKSIDER
jgi:hypothetical protein